MKGFAFKDNAAVIAGHRVPYSLLGAAAAILGAFLVWKFNQAGGLGLGSAPASTDLSTLLGNAYTPTDFTVPPGSTGGFAGGGSYPSSPVPSYVAPTIDYGPASSSFYAAPVYAAPAASSPITKASDPITQWQGIIGTGGGTNTTGRSSGSQIAPSAAPAYNNPVASGFAAASTGFLGSVQKAAAAAQTLTRSAYRAPAPAPAPVAPAISYSGTPIGTRSGGNLSL